MAGLWKGDNLSTHYIYALEWFIPSDAATCPIRTVDTEMVYLLRITVNQILADRREFYHWSTNACNSIFCAPFGNLGLGLVSSFFSMQDIGYHPFLQNRVCMSQSVGSYFFQITYFNWTGDEEGQVFYFVRSQWYGLYVVEADTWWLWHGLLGWIRYFFYYY